ncbi:MULTISPECIES: IclR family transcriptional regulator [unclassified Haladaptatus]|uniref:IclR family transcriptional regulator n=1 Tax=unclassified Haladaptatus TaxID=2622732 RepID=UPI00209C4C81|nr:MULTISPECIES: IclR family transcriptional regulator [unclassified Haladaptatus]MCO8244855.1 IclR family transcriptional regulator [Haladaptatus sp. AB643]MCO8255631.1 IclR family transcriptional regulator [Haladaptatus sp. AB618]
MPHSPNDEGSTQSLQTVTTALDVIDALEELGGTGVTELAEHLDLSKSAVYKHLYTLKERQYVVKDDNDYRLSLQFLTLGERVRNQNPLFRIGKPEIKKLADETGEYAHLTTEQYGLGINLCKIRGEQAVGNDYQITKKQRANYLHPMATGKAILAFLPEERVEWIVDRYGLSKMTDSTITDRETLYETLDEIREQGYAVNDGEEVEGLRAVGAPIHDRNGSVLGALSVSAPKTRLSGDQYHEHVPELVMRTANVIEVNLNMVERSQNTGPL